MTTSTLKTRKSMLEIDAWGSAQYAGFWTDKQRRHQYLSRLYEPLFAPYRDQHQRLLELGSAHGGSLTLWAEWFDSVELVGCDIHPNSANGEFIPDRARPKYDSFLVNHCCDGFTKSKAEEFGSFDIIIEDAEHSQRQMLQTIELYLPKVKQGGLLVIEDIHSAVSRDVLVAALAGARYTWHDFRSYTHTDDSQCLVVYKD
jgi:hypothetical protein